MARSVVEEYSRAQQRNDGATLKELRHAGFHAEWPQSGERVPSHEHDRKIHDNFPDFPQQEFRRVAGRSEKFVVSPLNTMVRVRGAGDLWVTEGLFGYQEGPSTPWSSARSATGC